LTVAGAAGAAVGVELGCGTTAERVTYRVGGFTCVTCAVGLETMLRGVRGVAEASASYAEHTVTIAFDAKVIGEDALKQFVSDCGFSVTA
jgi:copper chaperone CopZ